MNAPVYPPFVQVGETFVFQGFNVGDVVSPVELEARPATRLHCDACFFSGYGKGACRVDGDVLHCSGHFRPDRRFVYYAEVGRVEDE